MKPLCIVLAFIIFSLCSAAQTNFNDSLLWLKNDSNVYYMNGNIGINTENPIDKLEVVGDNDDNDGNVGGGITIKNNNYSRYTTEAYSNTFFRNSQIMGVRGRGTISNPEDVLPNDRVFGAYAHIIQNKQLNPTPIGSIEFYVGSEVASGEIRFATLSPGKEFRNDRMIVDQYGNVGVGTMKPTSKLHIADGDIYIEDITKGIIMKSPNSQCWRGKIDNNGELRFSLIYCPNLALTLDTEHNYSSKIINIYPNPSDNILNVNIQNRNKSTFYYKIYNIHGEIQDQGDIKTDLHEVNVVKLASALYVIAFYNDKGIPVTSKKFVKE